MIILKNYLKKRFLELFGYCLLGVLMIFLVVDLIENIDKFMDRQVSWSIIFKYYGYYIPYILVLIMPVATLLATVFSVGTLARHNELVAMKGLGFSLYQVIGTLLFMGLMVGIFNFVMAEGIVPPANRQREEIEWEYLKRRANRSEQRILDIEIQEPPDKIVVIGYYDQKMQKAGRIKIESYQNHHLVSRIDAAIMFWNGQQWVINEGYKRIFRDEIEIEAEPIDKPLYFNFRFTPKELQSTQIKPEELSIRELYQFTKRIRDSGGEVKQWMTDLHLRFAYPLSNLFIVLLSVPLAYNRRKKSIAVGFGISLIIVFFYFGIIKMGQTLGHSGSVAPLISAWMGNIIAGVGGIVTLAFVRK